MPSSASPTTIDRARQAADLLARIVRDHSPAVLASSFGAEDMVLVDLVAAAHLPIRVVTLDTGRLPRETHDLIDRVRSQYKLAVDVYAPDGDAVEAYVRDHGTNAFFESLTLRQQCCAIRKTEPLRRALAGAQAWVTGLRRAQAVTRAEIAMEEFDARHGIRKFNPLAQWSDEDVWSYLRGHHVPWNALHDRGYPSIGCAPCTRAVAPGEDARAGRWWWESPEHKECGLHRRPDVRAVPMRREVTA